MLSRRLEQVEQRRFREAIARFGAFWVADVNRPGGQEQDRAMLRAAGCDGDSLADIERWDRTQPAAERAYAEALEAAVFGIVVRPYQESEIRMALAHVAPYLGLAPQESPLAIIHALHTNIAEDSRRAG